MKSKNQFVSLLLVCVLCLSVNGVFSQVKIGDNPQNLDATSLLELESVSRVLVITRITSSQMESLSPLAGALVYNTDVNCLHFYNGTAWNNLCETNSNGNNLSITDNGDGSYTVNNGVDPPFTFNGTSETVTTLIVNDNNTFTYTNEDGIETIIDLGTSTNAIVSTLVDNGDGTFTYTDETNNQTTLDLNDTPSTLIDNNDGTYTYTDEVGTVTQFDVNTNQNQAVSTLVDNRDGTYTYTDESGTVTTFFVGNQDGRHFGQTGSVFFANNTSGDPTEDNANLFWDNDNKRLGIGLSSPASALHVNGIATILRVGTGTGSVDFPGYHFSTFFRTGIYAPPNDGLGFSVAGSEVMRLTPSQRVGINVQAPQATLHVGGNLIVDGIITTPNGTYKSASITSNTIRKLVNSKELVTNEDKTLIIAATVRQLVFEQATAANKGAIYILKSLGDVPIRLNIPYLNSNGVRSTTIPGKTVIWLQNDGVEWYQIN